MRNAAAEARAGLVTMPFEQVILWNPQVILTTDPNFWRSVWSDFDVDLRAKAREFHRRFYHRVPTEAQLDALLGEPGVLPK